VWKVNAMTCVVCKNDSLEQHCGRLRSACSWYRCLSCSTVIDVARRLLRLPGDRIVPLG
jgi:hypothetical protein